MTSQPNNSSSVKVPRAFTRRNSDTLGLAWLNGALHAGVFRKHAMIASWQAENPVPGLEEFEAALDAATEALSFKGSEVFLVLAHEQFVHQPEQAPAFSEAASRSYLRGRVERFEKEREQVLWVSQKTLSVRQEAAFLLHMLPSTFYGKLNSLLLSRRLDLTRILPLSVPLQLLLEPLITDKNQAVLLAADGGGATTIIAARPGEQLLFSRSMLTRWDTDPARLGVEVNRSLLYAKQQFATVIDKIWLLGDATEQVRNEVQTRCGAGKDVAVRATTPYDFLQVIDRLTPRHPVNLVAGYLGRKRRLQFIRRAVVGGCWLGFTLLALDSWSRANNWDAERSRLQQLQADETGLHTERDNLIKRNADAQSQRDFLRVAVDDRLPPVASKFLAFWAGVQPQEMYLYDFSVKWEPATQGWGFRAEGFIEGDEDVARDHLSALQKQLTRGAFSASIAEGARALVPVGTPGTDTISNHRFILEGVLFEN
jgi:hypothetical protein